VKSQAKVFLGQAIKNAGTSLTKTEASKISRSTGKSVAQVMAKAQDKGVALGSALVNQFNRGSMGPNLGDTRSIYGMPFGQPGVDKGTTRALGKLAPLQNLQMNKGTVYAGYSTTTTPRSTRNTPMEGFSSTPARTTYNPIVLPKSLLAPRKTALNTVASPTSTTTSATTETSSAPTTTVTTTTTPITSSTSAAPTTSSTTAPSMEVGYDPERARLLGEALGWGPSAGKSILVGMATARSDAGSPAATSSIPSTTPPTTPSTATASSPAATSPASPSPAETKVKAVKAKEKALKFKRKAQGALRGK